MNATGPAGFAAVSVTCLVVLALLQAGTFAAGRRIGRYNVVDVSWGLGFVLVAVAAAAIGGGDVTRRILVALLVAVWGLRLSWHMHTKSRGRGEDPRYEELLARSAGSRTAVVVRKIFLTQGVAQWFVSVPLQLSAVLGATSGAALAVLGLGVAVWFVGFAFEAVGDSQLARFKAEPANRGRIMDVGLWAWTRHPNYFGDACVWWGLWLVTASVWPGPLTIASPLLMTYFLVYATGARLLERSMSRRPGYAEYQERTGFFFPRVPRPS
ncbi:DUF1295 domain-containing protein [Rhodococcus sp. UNC363MFTsu5.1]|uniref:DUF1295 domain-containing protein n=1 Tax=Rhodococcus sp. UNC363MFTsu5.1 TaxID=1449069 RepID=UPI00048397A4|nr:DUF1295 domain-containing protein [Rhodococcus sp. UNC363MFTsu5.1]